MTDAERAKELLAKNSFTLVLVKEKNVYTSERRGVAPLLELLNGGADVRGFSAADRVVGKAAALLYCLLGVKEVYAEVMSELAQKALLSHGIFCESARTVPRIINRTGDGPCPMEAAVEHIDDPAAAKLAIEEKLKRMQNKKSSV